jgi:hypothetical protein
MKSVVLNPEATNLPVYSNASAQAPQGDTIR